MNSYDKSYDSLAKAAKEILEGNTSEDDKGLYPELPEDVEITEARLGPRADRSSARVSQSLEFLSFALRKGSELNKEINKTTGDNYDREFKDMKDSLDKVFDAFEDMQYQIRMNEENTSEGEELDEESLTEARSMDFNRTSQMLESLSSMLRKGSNLNKEVNKILGGNKNRDFKEMKDSLDVIYDIFQDIEGEIDRALNTYY